MRNSQAVGNSLDGGMGADARRFAQGPAVRSRRWLSNRSIDFMLLVGGVSLLTILVQPALKPSLMGL